MMNSGPEKQRRMCKGPYKSKFVWTKQNVSVQYLTDLYHFPSHYQVLEKFTCVTVNLRDFVLFLKLLHTHCYLMSVLKCLLLCPNLSDVCLLVCSHRNTQMILKHIIAENG